MFNYWDWCVCICACSDPSMKQEQRDALLQDLQTKLQRADKLLEQSHDTERFSGIGKYKLHIMIAIHILFFGKMKWSNMYCYVTFLRHSSLL